MNYYHSNYIAFRSPRHSSDIVGHPDILRMLDSVLGSCDTTSRGSQKIDLSDDAKRRDDAIDHLYTLCKGMFPEDYKHISRYND